MSRFSTLLFLAFTVLNTAVFAEPIDIGSRRELFIDGHLIDHRSDSVELTLHHPGPREVSIVFDAPWEGNNCSCHTVIQDGDLYRMYYRGSNFNEKWTSANFSPLPLGEGTL